MVMSFFRGDGSGGVTESVDRQITEMLGACRHSFDLAMSALVADDNITAIGDDVHETDDQVNELEETVRRELVVHAAVHGQADMTLTMPCILYTSDAADDLLCVELGGRRIIKTKKKNTTHHPVTNITHSITRIMS